MKINGIKISMKTILATRTHFTEIYSKCIEQALSGEIKVNDLDKYIESQQNHIHNTLTGNSDHTLTFLQHALWLQTGDCVAILN